MVQDFSALPNTVPEMKEMILQWFISTAALYLT